MPASLADDAAQAWDWAKTLGAAPPDAVLRVIAFAQQAATLGPTTRVTDVLAVMDLVQGATA